MELQLSTPVALPDNSFELDAESRVLFIGSCFAQYVGERMTIQLGAENCDVNPFGVLYNPMSIAQVLRLLIGGDENDAIKYVFQGHDGIWNSWMHTSQFSARSITECEKKIKARMKNACKILRDASLLVVTFGTTRCYRHDDIVVSNCHREPQRCFVEEEPTLDELIVEWKLILDELHIFNPHLQICFTVSPYRYKKYGFHQSQIQKAKLLLLAETLSNSNNVSYFPAYEIMMDELRDYRFYAKDMLHPSEQAIDIITDRFRDWCFTPRLIELADARIKEHRRIQHRDIM